MPRIPLAATMVVAALSFGVGLSTTPEQRSSGGFGLTLQTTTADAQTRGEVRRTARRTSRRTVRRQSYIRSLPAGCARRGAYYYCGGIYYAPQVQDGATVYVVVNP